MALYLCSIWTLPSSEILYGAHHFGDGWPRPMVESKGLSARDLNSCKQYDRTMYCNYHTLGRLAGRLLALTWIVAVL